MKRILLWLFVTGIALTIPLGIGIVWGYYRISRDLPRLETIDDYQPSATSQVFTEDNTLIGEFYGELGRRYPAKLSEIPHFVRNAFVAAEDASFYQHPGIDLASILRAFVKNLSSGTARQGGSTITQQVVKNLLLSREKKLDRKIKEAILSYQLEKRLSKDEILQIYLNEIFLGNGAYGIKAAARLYFHKELDQLTLAEAALLGGLPQAPSRFSPISNFEEARIRQHYVLDQMARAGFVTQEAAKEAAKEEIRVFRSLDRNFYAAPYYLSEVRRVISERFPSLRLDADGLRITAAVDLAATEMAEKALGRGLRSVDKRQGWRGRIGRIPEADPVQFEKEYGATIAAKLEEKLPVPALVLTLSPDSAEVAAGQRRGKLYFNDAPWAKRYRDDDGRISPIELAQVLKPGDVIEVSTVRPEEGAKPKAGTVPAEADLFLDQTPKLEGALVLLDPFSGKVRAIIGGYSYSRNQFNRASQSLRQPGSAFKPIVYLAAVDGYGYTAATLVNDSPRVFRVGNDVWQPGNFDESFLGAITLRTALQKSRNLVSADIVSRIGIDAAIQYARKLGITADLGRNLSLSLGSSEVSLLELSRAYGVFPSGGVLAPSTFLMKIESRDGDVLYDSEAEEASRREQVIPPTSAFIMAHLMRGVVERGTATIIRKLNRPAAGKTGTSNDQMDAWFVGYTPEWVCGIWAGFDEKRSIGYKETGGKVAAPIFLSFMSNFLPLHEKRRYEALERAAHEKAAAEHTEYEAPPPLEPADFKPPEGLTPFWVNADTGTQSSPDSPNAIVEYFPDGTAPVPPVGTQDSSSYLQQVDL